MWWQSVRDRVAACELKEILGKLLHNSFCVIIWILSFILSKMQKFGFKGRQKVLYVSNKWLFLYVHNQEGNVVNGETGVYCKNTTKKMLDGKYKDIMSF